MGKYQGWCLCGFKLEIFKRVKMITFQTPLITEEIDNKYARVTEPFVFWSDVLEKNGYGGQVAVPVDFTFDYESIPRIPIIYWTLAHTSKRGGT